MLKLSSHNSINKPTDPGQYEGSRKAKKRVFRGVEIVSGIFKQKTGEI